MTTNIPWRDNSVLGNKIVEQECSTEVWIADTKEAPLCQTNAICPVIRYVISMSTQKNASSCALSFLYPAY